MKRQVLGSRFYFSYSDGQVENKCHGETGPLSAYKWSFQNTHQKSWRNALVQGKREKPFFCSVLGSSFFNTLQGLRCLESFSGCQDGSRYYQFTVYIPLLIYCLSMEIFRSLRMNNIGIRAEFLNFPLIECDLVSGFCSFDLCEPGFVFFWIDVVFLFAI